MADEQVPRKLFSEKEVGRILKRATELQEDKGPADTMGLSLEEVRQIAMEMGVDPRHVEAAMLEVQRNGDADERFYWLGAPVSYEMERVVKGDVSEEQWAEMVDAIHRSFNLVGVSGQVGRLLEWTHNSRRRQVQVRVTSRGGKTRIRIYARYPKTAAVTFAVPMALSYMAASLFVAAMGNFTLSGFPALIIGLLGTVFLVMRFVFGRMVDTKKRKARQLLNQLEQIVAEPLPAASLSKPEKAPRLDASLLDEATPGEASVPIQSRTKTSL